MGFFALWSALAACTASTDNRNPGERGTKSIPRQYQDTVRIAEIRWKEGNYQSALSILDTARLLARKMTAPEKEVGCLMLQGKMAWALGRMEESEKLFSEALLLARTLDLQKEAEESEAYLKIGELYARGRDGRFLGQPEKSILDLNAAIELARKAGSKEHEVKCLRQLSLAYLDRQEADVFLAVNQRALEMARGLNDRREQAKCLINIGLYYFGLREYTLSLNCYSEALDLSVAIDNKEDQSNCLKNISLILFELGFYERSLDHLLAAQAIDKQSGNTFFLSRSMSALGEAYRNKALVFSNKEDLYRALDYSTSALESARERGDQHSETVALSALGNIYLDLKKFHTALHYFGLASRLAEKAQNDEAMMGILNNIGTCWLNLGNLQAAEEYFRRALEFGNQIGEGRVLWEPMFNLGQCYEKSGRPEKALACYRNSIEAIDHIRSQILSADYRVGFGRGKDKVYQSMLALLCRSYADDTKNELEAGAEEILLTAEKAKARAFLESLGEVKSDLRRRLPLPLQKRERELSGQIAAIIGEMSGRDLPRSKKRELEEALDQAEEEYLRLTARMRTEAPEIAVVVSPLPIGLAQARELLPDDRSAILEYFLGEEGSHLFLVTKTDLALFPLPPRQQIETSLSAYLKLLSDPPKGRWDGLPAAKRLSRELLHPAIRRLPRGVQNILIVPDGCLCYLPFETLPLLQNEQASGEDYLISRFAVSYAPSCSSLSILMAKDMKAAPPKDFLAFGNPFYSTPARPEKKTKITVAGLMKEIYVGQGYDLASLERSETEIKDISAFFSKSRRDIYLGKRASEEAIKNIPLGNYRIVHFACHGFLDETVPFRSGLFLSSTDGGGEDGFLQAREIAGFRLNADLVVLSACRTRRGYIEKGEGIMGLTRIFFSAGARSVVSTLWEISDRAAVPLMRDFYDGLSRGKSKAQALRAAKLRMLESGYSHPFYWAAFILNGEPFSVLRFN